MNMTTTDHFDLCTHCGEPVARLLSRNGKLYSVRIDINKIHEGIATVGRSDFHTCDPNRVVSYRAAKAAKVATATEAIRFSAIAQFFGRATAKGAKRIAITLHADASTMVELKYSRNKNVIYITDGRGFGISEYYGAISMDGSFREGRCRIDAKRNEVLCNFEHDPVATAVSSARISSNCSFCGLKLTDERSVVAGYGPQCADKYSLPWGKAGSSGLFGNA